MIKFIIPVLVISILANLILAFHHIFIEKTVDSVTPKTIQYPFLAKRIFLEKPSDIIINFTRLREQLRGFSNSFENVKVGIYFEYLFSGQVVGINDREVFYVASLPKIPMAMEAMKRVENGEIALDEKLTIKKEYLDNLFGELYKKGAGSQITVEEAIRLSVVESDNTAYKVLKDRVGDDDLSDIYAYLDIPQEVAEPGRGITPKNYSSILKSLYFSSYLSYENSNELLEIMTIPSKMDRLSKGVPKDVKVANKFGVYNVDDLENQVYSDCGIVYNPERRYILCVMVRGAKVPDEAGEIISDISKITYDYVNEANAESLSAR